MEIPQWWGIELWIWLHPMPTIWNGSYSSSTPSTTSREKWVKNNCSSLALRIFINLLVQDSYVLRNNIEEALMYNPYPLVPRNGSLLLHDCFHPKCFTKRLVILHVLFKFNPNLATQLDMDYFERKVVHELMVEDEKFKYMSLVLVKFVLLLWVDGKGWKI